MGESTSPPLVVDIKYAISAALNDQKALEITLDLSCSTGNCTFPPGDPSESDGRRAINDSSTYSTVGICHHCSDISNLITTNVTNTTFSHAEYGYVTGWIHTANAALPNGQSITWVEQQTDDARISYLLDDDKFGKLKVSAADCSWWDDQDMDGPCRTALRWSLANFTILSRTSAGCTRDSSQDCHHLPESPDATHPLVVACYLYPCMRVYGRPSIEAAKLTEPLISSIPLELSKLVVPPGDPQLYNWTSSDRSLADTDLTNDKLAYTYDSMFTAIKSPCKIADSVYTSHNMTLASNLSQIKIWKIDSRDVMTGNISTAPPECLYQMHAGFWHALRTQFLQTPAPTTAGAPQIYKASIFDGVCRDKPESACIGGSLPWPGLMNEKWLASVAHNGKSSLATIEDRVGSFAVSITRSFRTTLGSKLPLNLYWIGSPVGANSSADQDSGHERVRTDYNYIQGSTLVVVSVIEITWE